MKSFFLISATILTAFLFNSCKKVEGPGGRATIKGTINAQVFNLVGDLINEYPKAKEDVFLIYGTTNTFYDDDVKTSYDGSFEFPYLQKGEYKVFVYQDCDTCPSGKEAVIIDVEISESKQIVDLGTINIVE